MSDIVSSTVVNRQLVLEGRGLPLLINTMATIQVSVLYQQNEELTKAITFVMHNCTSKVHRSSGVCACV